MTLTVLVADDHPLFREGLRALLDGRPAPSEADVRSLAAAALRHRILVYPAAGRERVTSDQVVEAVLRTL